MDFYPVSISVLRLNQGPIRMFLAVFSQGLENSAQLGICQKNTVASGRPCYNSCSKTVQHKYGGNGQIQLSACAFFYDDPHGSLHKNPKGFSFGGFDFYQISDSSLMDKGENLGQIDIFQCIASGHLRELHPHVHRQLHQGHR